MEDNPYEAPKILATGPPNTRWIRGFCRGLTLLIGWMVGLGTLVVVVWMLYQVLNGLPTR